MAIRSIGERLNSPRRRAVAAVAVAAAALIAVAIVVAPGNGRPPGSIGASPGRTGAAPGSPVPGTSSAGAVPTAPPVATTTPVAASPSAAAPGGPSPIPSDTWTGIVLPPAIVVADLVPDDVDRSGVGVMTTFTLRTLGSASASELASRVEAQPPLAFASEPGPDAGTVTLRPAAPLVPGATYRFILRTAAGTVAGSWAFRARQPLHVVTTLPGDESTDVPLDSGIELTFDQDGVTGAESHFRIEPAVAGRFEQHARTLVFVPRDSLAPASVYRVTLMPGVAIQGSDQVLESEVTFSFETGGPDEPGDDKDQFELGRSILESPPDEPPVLGVFAQMPDPAPRRIPVEVYRLPSLEAAVEAAHQIVTSPRWAERSSNGLVPTDDLPSVLSFDGLLELIDPQGGHVIRFPLALDPGWYLVVLPRDGRDEQALLQVTDVAVYAMATETTTVVWANDIATGTPIAGAQVRTRGGAQLRASDATGLSISPTPADLRPTSYDVVLKGSSIVVVTAPDGRGALAALGIQSGPMYAPEASDISRTRTGSERFWLVFSTDRSQFRRTDSINAFGIVRERDTGEVPQGLELRLVTQEGSPAIAAVRVEPDARGMFAGSITYADLPLGSYAIELWAGDEQLASSYVGVADIRKPAYAITVGTGRRAYVVGDRIRATAAVAFFDGTLAPGVELVIGGRRATTDGNGRASVLLTADAEGQTEAFGYHAIAVAPAHPEEGEISGWAEIVIFPGNAWIEALGTLGEGRLQVAGTLTTLDRDRLEREFADRSGEVNPAGIPIGAAPITATITELVPVRKVIGQSYDFISKRAVPIYSYTIREDTLGRRTLTTAADGSFTLELDVDAPEHQHRVVLATRDEDGHAVTRTLELSPARPPIPVAGRRPLLADQQFCGLGEATRYGIGDPLEVTFHDASGPLPTGGANRYLFTVSRQGLLDAQIERSPSIDREFQSKDVPNTNIGAVWFTGRGYVPSSYPAGAAIDLAERTMTVTITPDQARYQPGDMVTLRVQTLDRAGRPAPASVMLRAVDEKLYAIGAAADLDLLPELYRFVDSGILGTFSSHQPPFPLTDYGCGDTTGGGGDDFRDWLLFRTVATGPDGVATVTFPLSDDLTSWHVAAAGITASYEAGTSHVRLPVGLPFFVEAVLAPEYLVDEQPVLRLRGFGEGLVAGDPVVFTVDAPTILTAPITLEAQAFEPAALPLPRLPLGRHTVTITAQSGTGVDRRTYRLVRRLTAVSSRSTRNETTIAPLAPDWRPDAASGLTTLTITDAGRGRFLAALSALARGGGARLDQAIAADVARQLLVEVFGQEDWAQPSGSFDPGPYQTWRGLALLPYAGPDPLLSVRVALSAPDRVDASRLREALSAWAFMGESTTEQRAMALAALAALGDPVLVRLGQLAEDPDLTIRERLYVGIGLAAGGDDARARSILRDLLTGHGERLGPWVRLAVGTSLDDTLEATGLLALLAAAIGDPIAADAEAYVEANPGRDDVFALHQLAYIRRALERADPTPGRFAATIGGVRSEHDLPAGGSWSVTLTPAQVATVRLEPLAGELAIIATRDVAFDPTTVATDPDVTIARAITPAGDLPSDRLVQVLITIRFGPRATAGCYEVTDRLPSGLAPLVRSARVDADLQPVPDDALAPYVVEGQRVAWCIGPTTTRREFRLAYSARVVTPGTYHWEPATVQSTSGSDRVTSTPPLTITIR